MKREGSGGFKFRIWRTEPEAADFRRTDRINDTYTCPRKNLLGDFQSSSPTPKNPNPHGTWTSVARNIKRKNRKEKKRRQELKMSGGNEDVVIGIGYGLSIFLILIYFGWEDGPHHASHQVGTQ